MKISVIVPIYNALDETKLLLKSLVKNFNFSDGEVILVNDYSDKKTENFLNKFIKNNPNFQLLNNEENVGFIKTCNKGIAYAKNDIIVLLNSDTIIPKNFCAKIIECFELNPKVGIASPIASCSWQHYIEFPVFHTIDSMNDRLNKYHKAQYPLIPSGEGFCFCIRREVINIIGALDEAYYRGYHEEIDFSYRAISVGWNIVLIDNLYVYHKA